ncbi:MAG: hypothetical protein ACRENP_10555 [Longimicrobiales bacterium]
MIDQIGRPPITDFQEQMVQALSEGHSPDAILQKMRSTGLGPERLIEAQRFMMMLRIHYER